MKFLKRFEYYDFQNLGNISKSELKHLVGVGLGNLPDINNIKSDNKVGYIDFIMQLCFNKIPILGLFKLTKFNNSVQFQLSKYNETVDKNFSIRFYIVENNDHIVIGLDFYITANEDEMEQFYDENDSNKDIEDDSIIIKRLTMYENTSIKNIDKSIKSVSNNINAYIEYCMNKYNVSLV